MASQWNERAQGLRQTRLKKQTRNTRGARNKHGDNILQKARALERRREAEGRSPISKYDVVPPLKRKMNAFERTVDDDDSWGEASEPSDEDDYYKSTQPDNPALRPQNFPLPPMSFALVPVQHPGFLENKQSKHKQPPKKDGGKTKSKPIPLTSTHQDAGVNTETQTDIHVEAYEHQPANHYHDDLPSYQRSQNIYPNLSKRPTSEEKRLLGEAALRFYDDRHFADRYTNDFINSYLHDQMIPDILIDIIDETYNKKPTYDRSVVNPPVQISPRVQPYLGSPLPMRPEHRDGGRVQNLVSQADVSKQVVNDLISDYLSQQVAVIVRETCSEFVQGFLDKDAPEKMLAKLTDEIAIETCYSMFAEIKKEAAEEQLLDEHVTDEVIEELLIDVAFDTLDEMNNKVKETQFKELSEGANEKFLDGIMLDYLLEQIVKQERLYVDSTPTAHFIQDSMTLDILLRKVAELEISQQELLDVKPVKRFHERVVTDVVMDLLLNELCLNIDEDMKDYDEYELGLSDYLLTNGFYGDPSPSRQSV